MRFACVIAALVVSQACGAAVQRPEFSVGRTAVEIHDGAEPWPLLPESIFALQFVTEKLFPEKAGEIIDFTLHLYPHWMPVPSERGRDTTGIVCVTHAYTSGDIHARVTGLTVSQSCLAHEWQHRIDLVISGDPNADHLDPFNEQVAVLNAFLAQMESYTNGP